MPEGFRHVGSKIDVARQIVADVARHLRLQSRRIDPRFLSSLHAVIAEAQAEKAVEPAIGAVEREFMMIAMDVREKARRFERNPRNVIALGHVPGEAQGIRASLRC